MYEIIHNLILFDIYNFANQLLINREPLIIRAKVNIFINNNFYLYYIVYKKIYFNNNQIMQLLLENMDTIK